MSQGCVTAQTFVEIDQNIFFPFFSLLFCRGSGENEEGQWNKEASCIFGQTRLSWKKQFSVSHRNFGHYTPRDGLQRYKSSMLQEFYDWLDEGRNAMAEAGTRERNNDSAGVTEVEVIVEAGGHEINAGAASVTANSGNTSKTKETGQKRKRYYFSVVQTTFLEAQLKDNKLDTPEDRQKVAAVFTKETKETFDVERIHTWFRNHKNKNKRGGGEGEGGS